MKLIRRNEGSPRRRAAAVVEMAVVLPFLIMIVMGIVEFGRAMMISNVIASATRLGARTAILDSATNFKVRKQVREFCADALGCSTDDINVTITVAPDPDGDSTADPGNQVANATTGDLCTVEVKVAFDKLAFISSRFLKGRSLSAKCTMQKE